MRILEKLYNGEVYPFEQIVPKSDKYKALQKRQIVIRDILSKDMTAKQKELLDEFYAVMLQAGNEFAKENYYYGVKLGAEFMMDVSYGDKPIKEEE
ncbi:MAG TPA: hypothetical protein DEP23_01360 [Ruminococcaceae bacterium]|nr:hypothetical protein [Oscillospiraceae bacterium]